MKTCTNKDCKEINPQPLDNFCKNNASTDGLQYKCRSCSSINFKEWQNINREHNRARQIIANRTQHRRLGGAKRDAKIRGYDWTLTQEEWFAQIAENKCHYCQGILNETGSNLDRKDNSIGYLLTNVVPCCIECNTIKGPYLSYEEMLIVSKALREYRIQGITPRLNYVRKNKKSAYLKSS